MNLRFALGTTASWRGAHVWMGSPNQFTTPRMGVDEIVRVLIEEAGLKLLWEKIGAARPGPGVSRGEEFILPCRQTGEFPAISFEEPADLASAPGCRNSCGAIRGYVMKLPATPNGCGIKLPNQLLSGNAGATSRLISRRNPAPLRRWTPRPCGDRRGRERAASEGRPWRAGGYEPNFILLFPLLLSCYSPVLRSGCLMGRFCAKSPAYTGTAIATGFFEE